MRWTALAIFLGGCLLLAGCGGGDGSSGPVASAPPPGSAGTPPGDASYSPPQDDGGGTPPGDAAQATPMDDGYTPPSDGGTGTYDGGAESPGYNPDGMGPDGMPLRPRIKSVREQALDALRRGNQTDGFQLLSTHLAVSPAAQADVATKIAWIPALRRPAMGPRIGIAAQYTQSVGDFADSPQPIGSTQLKQALAAAQNAGRAGKGADAEPAASYGGEPGMNADGTQSAEKQLEFYTGDLGTKLLAALKGKLESGEYGPLYKELAEELARPAPTFDPNNPGDPNFASGTSGDGYVDPGTGVPAADGQAAAGPAKLGVALTWLGKFDKEKKADLAALVQEAGIDLLVTYEIDLSAAKVGNLIVNKTRFKITDLKRNEALFTSTLLDNRAVMQGREKGLSEEDPVEKQVTRAIAELDKVCKPTELPAAVNAERVKTRIAGLIAEKPADPLPVLLEMRFYAAKGLLTDSEMHAAAVSLLGEVEYAQLIASSSAGDVSNVIGGAMGLPGMLDLMRGVNTATGASARAKARKAQDQTNPTAGEPAKRGWGGLLPPGWTGR